MANVGEPPFVTHEVAGHNQINVCGELSHAQGNHLQERQPLFWPKPLSQTIQVEGQYTRLKTMATMYGNMGSRCVWGGVVDHRPSPSPTTMFYFFLLSLLTDTRADNMGHNMEPHKMEVVVVGS